MRPGRLLIWGVGGKAERFSLKVRPSSLASQLPQILRPHQILYMSKIHVGAGLPAMRPVQTAQNHQNDRTIRPNVSMAFSDSSVHGLP